MELLRRAALFVLGAARRHELVVLEGAERSGGRPLCVAFAGGPDVKHALVKRAFAGEPKERSLGKVPVWLSSRAVGARAPGADLVVRRVPAHYECLPGKGVLARLPAWVRVRIDLRDPACAARGKEKLARMRGKARKAGFAFEIASGEAAFADFYDRLHLPYVRGRHGETASIQGREETLSKLRTGEWRLLAVRSGAEVVAAGTVEFRGERARFWQLGVRGGERALLEEGAADAVYCYVEAEARARGCSTLHLGHSRPFARDGVLEYKRMLGAYVDGGDERRGSLELSVRRMVPALADFLADNPLIAREGDGSCRLYGFVRGGAKEAGERADWLRSRYCFKRNLGLKVLVLDDAL